MIQATLLLKSGHTPGRDPELDMKKTKTQHSTSPTPILSVVVKLVCVTICVLLFSYFSYLINEVYMQETKISSFMFKTMGFLIVGALLGVAVSSSVQTALEEFHRQMLSVLRRVSPQVMATSSLGLVVGMIFATLAGLPLYIYFPELKNVGFILTLVSGVVFGYLGILIFSRLSLWSGERGLTAMPRDAARPKVCDTSAIIDGRVYDLAKNGLLDGRIIIPSLALNELQGIADDKDPIRKQRGRRGLDLVDKLREIEGANVEVVEVKKDKNAFDETVDAQLIAYTKSVGGVLVTNDYNLTRVAELRGVAVLNLNLLANTFRKALLPGEIEDVHVVRYGKESGQGIAYLDDGTMIVIESGDKFIGESVTVEINSIMQTVAGRLIFARIASEQHTHTNGD